MRRKEHFIFKNGAELRNPIVMAPMTTYESASNGAFSKKEMAYYKARSVDVGMMITGCSAVSSNGYGFRNPLEITDDNLEDFKHFTFEVKQNGTKVILQLFHAGRMALREELREQPMISASAVPAARPGAETPKEMTQEEILQMIQNFYEATRRAIQAGFDGVELHGANTFLIQQFFSPHSNRRTDEWGGDLEKRSKFPLEVIKAALAAKKKYASEEFIIGYRISLEELEKPGITLNDSLFLIDKLADSGIDYLHLSLKKGYDQGSIIHTEDPTPIGKSVIEKVNGRIPVVGVSNIVTDSDMQAAFDFGYDLVAIGKAMILNPRLLSKLDEGQQPREFFTIDEAEEELPRTLIEMIETVASWSDIIKR